MADLEKIGEIIGVSFYYDADSELTNILVGRKDNTLSFMIGPFKDIKPYKEFLRRIKKEYNREFNLEELLDI